VFHLETSHSIYLLFVQSVDNKKALKIIGDVLEILKKLEIFRFINCTNNIMFALMFYWCHFKQVWKFFGAFLFIHNFVLHSEM